MRSQDRIEEQTKARKMLGKGAIYFCVFAIGLAFGEVITNKKTEGKILCYKYFDVTSYRKVSGKIYCKTNFGDYRIISQSKIDAYRRSN